MLQMSAHLSQVLDVYMYTFVDVSGLLACGLVACGQVACVLVAYGTAYGCRQFPAGMVVFGSVYVYVYIYTYAHGSQIQGL